MKRFIRQRIMLITTAAILVTAVLCTWAYYRVFEREVRTDLAAYTVLLADRISLSGDEILSGGTGGTAKTEKTPTEEEERRLAAYAANLSREHLRMTLIDENGSVVFDNVAGIETLGNHMDREEIREALEDGEGWSIRRSDTFRRVNYYFAIRLPDGGVLRTARETSSMFSVFLGAVPVIALIGAAMIALCWLYSQAMAQLLLVPIRSLPEHLEDPEKIETYEELEPVIAHISRQHREILENANLRQEFTANVSHELKTPLTSISGYAQLIESGVVSQEDTVRFGHEIRRNADRLLTLINDIIRLSELDSIPAYGKKEKKEPVDLFQIAVTCADMLEPSCEEHGVTIKVEGESTPVLADRTMLDELVYNLCDNAIRYNRQGGSVTVKVGDRAISVEDTGIGIAEENLKRVFERFFRVDKSRSKKTGGTGLGLAIVKHIVEYHHAEMDTKSVLGKGTTITVRFPEEPAGYSEDRRDTP